MEVQWKEVKVKMLGVQLKFFVYEIDHLLIDTGPNNKFSELLSFFQELNPQQIVLTHIHEDHSGNAST